MTVPVGSHLRTTAQLFRDCLRLVNHIAGKSRKGDQLRKIVGGEFRKNSKVEDEERISQLKSNAIRALANYLMIESSTKDLRFRDKTAAFSTREAKNLKVVENTKSKKEEEK